MGATDEPVCRKCTSDIQAHREKVKRYNEELKDGLEQKVDNNTRKFVMLKDFDKFQEENK